MNKINYLKILFCALLAIIPYGTKAQSTPPTLCGILRYSDAPTIVNGLYTIEATENAAPTLYWRDSDLALMGNGGAVYANGKYYVLSFLDFGVLLSTYVVADIEEQTYELMDKPTRIDFSYIASDMTYDVTTGLAYAISLHEKGDGSFVLSTMDLENAVKTSVGKIMQMCALAADKNGKLYGIAMDGVLYEIDKETARITAIGPTGVTPSSDQSATFDLETGILYWSAYTEQGGALYTVDTTTGEATLLSTYPNGEQITGLFVKPAPKTAGTPTEIDDVYVNFEKDALSGNISFELPFLDINEAPLEGELAWGIEVNGKIAAEGKGLPGELVECPLTLNEEGKYQFVIHVSNSAGSATPYSFSKFIGMDIPLPPSNIIAKAVGKEVTLTWETSNTGVNGGYVDEKQLIHQIIRMPEGEVVAEMHKGNTYTEYIDQEGIHAHYYLLTPDLNGRTGEQIASDVISVGEYMSVPFTDYLTDIMRYAVYSTIDANNDGDSWVWGNMPEGSTHEPCATYMWTISAENDDWIVTPAIRLEAGKSYRADFYIRSESNKYTADFSISLGKNPTVESMTRTLRPVETLQSEYETAYSTEEFKVDEDGTYHLGLHILGKRSNNYIYFTRLHVTDDMTGISPTLNEELGAFVQGGELYVPNKANLFVEIFNIEGKNIYKGNVQNIRLSLPSGIYIIKSNGKVRKVIL